MRLDRIATISRPRDEAFEQQSVGASDVEKRPATLDRAQDNFAREAPSLGRAAPILTDATDYRRRDTTA